MMLILSGTTLIGSGIALTAAGLVLHAIKGVDLFTNMAGTGGSLIIIGTIICSTGYLAIRRRHPGDRTSLERLVFPKD